VCGRFNITDDPLLRALLGDLGLDIALRTQVNIAPTEDIPLVRDQDGQRSLAMVRWWLVPPWAKEISTRFSMFNARSETILQSKAFARPFKTQRGIVPASSYIEWHTEGGRKTPWLVKPVDSAIAFAAVWERWHHGDAALDSCALLTTDATPSMAAIHPRMPVMLAPADYAAWLDPTTPVEQLQHMVLPRLHQHFALATLDRAVGNSRNKGEALLEPTSATRLIEPED